MYLVFNVRVWVNANCKRVRACVFLDTSNCMEFSYLPRLSERGHFIVCLRLANNAWPNGLLGKLCRRCWPKIKYIVVVGYLVLASNNRMACRRISCRRSYVWLANMHNNSNSWVQLSWVELFISILTSISSTVDYDNKPPTTVLISEDHNNHRTNLAK